MCILIYTLKNIYIFKIYIVLECTGYIAVQTNIFLS